METCNSAYQQLYILFIAKSQMYWEDVKWTSIRKSCQTWSTWMNSLNLWETYAFAHVSTKLCCYTYIFHESEETVPTASLPQFHRSLGLLTKLKFSWCKCLKMQALITLQSNWLNCHFEHLAKFMRKTHTYLLLHISGWALLSTLRSQEDCS